MPFNDTQIESIIREYGLNKAALGRFPVPTRETIQVIEATKDLVAPLDLTDGKAEIEDELGHIAIAVLHLRTANIQNAFVVAFSGGRSAGANFDKIRAVMKPGPLLTALNKVGAPSSQVAFQFEYNMRSDVAEWPCAEPKALVAADSLDSTLLGFAARWCAVSQLATPHRMNISFVSTRYAFLLPCDQCRKLFNDASRWLHIHI